MSITTFKIREIRSSGWLNRCEVMNLLNTSAEQTEPWQ